MNMVVENMSWNERRFLKIVLEPTAGVDRFAINIGHNANNFALHFNPRFSQKQVALNSKFDGDWDSEIFHDMELPFKVGDENAVVMRFNEEMFNITLPDGQILEFPNRLCCTEYNYMEIHHVRIISLEIL